MIKLFYGETIFLCDWTCLAGYSDEVSKIELEGCSQKHPKEKSE